MDSLTNAALDHSLTQLNPRRQKKMTYLGCTTTAVIAIIGFVVVAFLFSGYRSRQLLNDEINAIRALGEPTTAAELDANCRLPPDVIDSTELWLKVTSVTRSPKFFERARGIDVIGLDPGSLTGSDATWLGRADAEKFLNDYAEVLFWIHEACDQGGHARFPIDYGRGSTVLLPDHSELRNASRLLRLEAFVRAHAGDLKGCTDTLIASTKVSNATQNHVTLIEHLIGLSLDYMAASTALEIISHWDLPETQLAELQSAFEQDHSLADLKRAFINERVLAVTAQLGPSPPDGLQKSLFPHDDVWFQIKVWNRAIAACDRSPESLLEEVDTIERDLTNFSWIQSVRYRNSPEMLPALRMVSRREVSSVTLQRLTSISLALVRYRKKHQAFPNQLSDLQPEFLATVPTDWLDGSPFHYQLNERGFKLWANGPDGTNDGGISKSSGQSPDIVIDFPVEIRGDD